MFLKTIFSFLSFLDPPQAVDITLSRPLNEDLTTSLNLSWRITPQDYNISAYQITLMPVDSAAVLINLTLADAEDNFFLLTNLTSGEMYNATIRSISSAREGSGEWEAEAKSALSDVSNRERTGVFQTFYHFPLKTKLKESNAKIELAKYYMMPGSLPNVINLMFCGCARNLQVMKQLL